MTREIYIKSYIFFVEWKIISTMQDNIMMYKIVVGGEAWINMNAGEWLVPSRVPWKVARSGLQKTACPSTGGIPVPVDEK